MILTYKKKRRNNKDIDYYVPSILKAKKELNLKINYKINSSLNRLLNYNGKES